MATVKFNGVRVRPFTLYFPSERSRHIEPEVSREVELNDDDAAWLLETAEPGIWTPVEATIEAAPTLAEEAAPGETRSVKRTRTAAAEDGKS